jgi:hypothetical protein
MKDDDNYEDFYENQPLDSCPQCGRSYDDIDFDFQACSKCGWDADRGRYKHEIKRQPTEYDYLNGEADILTDEWR